MVNIKSIILYENATVDIEYELILLIMFIVDFNLKI